MIDYKHFDLYAGETVDKQLVISFDGVEITNSDLHQEEFELTESLCSESQLVFGSCEASEVRFRISHVFIPLKDKWLTITQTLNGDTENPLQIGKYKVYSDVPTADRSYRDVVAYDSMYDIINTDVASWYNALKFPMSQKAFRDSFFAFFGIEQEEVSLVNDLMEIERTIEPSVLSGKDVIQSICQLNGCFGNIGRDGKFQYIILKNIVGGLYPSNDIYPSDNLYPQQPNVQIVSKGLYVESPTYEDFTVKPIDKLQIREKEGDIGAIAGDGDNAYIVEDNFLVYGKSTEDLTTIAENMLSVIQSLEYRPFSARVVGNPCFEVGDMIRLHTKYQIIDSYIMQRTLNGIQCLRDDWSSGGEEYQSEKVNDIQTQITQLKGKSNILERTVDETRSTIADVEEGLQSEISQIAEAIRLEVAEETNELSSEIEQTQSYIVLGVNSKGKMVLVELSADRETGTAFSVDANNIDLSAEDVINLLAGGTLNLTGKNIEIESDNFNVDSDGNCVASNFIAVNKFKMKSTTRGEVSIISVYDDTLSDGLFVEFGGDGVGTISISSPIICSDIDVNGGIGVVGGVTANGLYSHTTIQSMGDMYSGGNFTANTSIQSNGSVKAVGSLWAVAAGEGTDSSDAAVNVRVGAEGKIMKTTGSAKRFKEDFKDELSEELNPHALYDLWVGSYKFKKDYLTDKTSNRYGKDVIGIIADDLLEKYPVAADYHIDKNGNKIADDWNDRYLVPAMLKLIQEQHEQLEAQQQEIDTLKEQVSFLMQKLGDDING